MRRPAIRPPRGTKRVKPRVVKGFMRIAVGSEILYLTAGTNNTVKLLRENVGKIEEDSRKQIEEMTEEELEESMNRLGMKSIALTEDEKLIAKLASKYILAGYFIMKG